ncbi:MAG: polysaccharide deacetylase family protein, partial [Gammaproteobacteria bacterium]|nr:polysaccharide deacetylase family protein [Gammaproteobacteria bacterium]
VTEALPELQSRGLPGTFFIATAFLNGGRMFNDTVIETVRRLESPVDLEAFGLASARLDDMDSRRNLVGKILKEVKYLEPGERDEWVTRFAALAPGSLPDDLMMTDDQVRQLHSAGMEVGGHTHNHPILARVGPDEARTEIDQGRDRLQTITGAPVVSFAYPNGIPGVDYLDMHPLLLQEMGWRQAVTTAWGSVRADSDWLQLPRISPWDRTPLRLVARLVRSYLQAPGRTV